MFLTIEDKIGDSDNADLPYEDQIEGDVLAEKKRAARRRFLMGTAAAGAVLGTVSRANAVGVSVCISFTGMSAPGLENNPGLPTAFAPGIFDCADAIGNGN